MALEVRRFQTLTEFIECAKACGAHSDDAHWAGGTFADAIAHGEHGWPDGARQAQELSRRIADRIIEATPVNDPEYGYDVAGACFDAGAIYSGVPEAWGMIYPVSQKREVKICANIAVSAGVNKEAMMARGIATCALMLALQARGYQISLAVGSQTDWMHRYDGDKAGRHIWITIADASTGSQLDIDRIVFAIAYPAFFRQLVLAYYGNDSYRLAPTDYPKPECDLYLGGAHLNDVERWQDGGEAWIIGEYIRQTTS